MSFRNIPFKSALIEERVNTEYEGEINGHGEKEGLPTEYRYEFEQEMKGVLIFLSLTSF